MTPLASPVAALFLALAGVRMRSALGARPALAIAVAALAPVALLAVAFPEGGVEPFAPRRSGRRSRSPRVALVVLPRAERTLRIGVRAVRARAHRGVRARHADRRQRRAARRALRRARRRRSSLWRRRTLALACVAPSLLWWQLGPAVRDVRIAKRRPGVHAAYYAPLLAVPGGAARTAAAGRVEIPFTTGALGGAPRRARDPARARLGAPARPRGQPAVLRRRARSTPARYRAWLDRMAVRWVAVPDVQLDYSAQDEARLIARGLPYLRLAWRGAHWRVYAVARPAPLADPRARAVLHAGTDALTLAVPRAGDRQPARALDALLGGRRGRRLRRAATATGRACACAARPRPAGDALLASADRRAHCALRDRTVVNSG